MQEGKGGGLSGLGGGAIGDTFGFSNASTELRKLTRYSAVVFFVVALLLTYLGDALIQNPTKEFFKGAATEENVVTDSPATKTAAEEEDTAEQVAAQNAPAKPVTTKSDQPITITEEAIPVTPKEEAPATPVSTTQ